MTYEGVRARPLASENGRLFEVSKVRIGPDGRVSDVLWGEVDADSLTMKGTASLGEMGDATWSAKKQQ